MFGRIAALPYCTFPTNQQLYSVRIVANSPICLRVEGQNRALNIPFDSLCVAASVNEIAPIVGGRLQKLIMPTPHSFGFEFYAGKVEWVVASWHAQYARIHISDRPSTKIESVQLTTDFRRRILGAELKSVKQIGSDRIVELEFEGAEGRFRLILEMMGKHSNLMLVDDSGRVVAAAKWLGKTKSKRPILPNQPYFAPPVGVRPRLPAKLDVSDAIRQKLFSPFLTDLLVESESQLGEVVEIFAGGACRPVSVQNVGVYPVSVAALMKGEQTIDSFGKGADAHFSLLESGALADSHRSKLTHQLDRVILARETALHELQLAATESDRAAEFQQLGELILAYGYSASVNDGHIEVYDYAGNLVQIPYDPEESVQENANRIFGKAKRAKARQEQVLETIQGFEAELEELRKLRANLDLYDSDQELSRAEEFASVHRWLNAAPLPKEKEDRPYEGHKIRETMSRQGYRILYGENAVANDYLTLRVAKSNDWWVHVRGNVSAHVVIQSKGAPDKVPLEVIQVAAMIAVKHSPLKHSSYVPVDYTLKRYVRRQKGSPAGMVTYTHEKTLHVDART